MLDKAGGNPLWVVEMLRSLSEEGRLRHEGATIEVAAPDLPGSLRELVVRRLRYLSEPTLALLRITAVVGDSVSVRDVATVARRPAREVISQLDEAFRAGFLVADGDDVVFRHQLVHDAIYLSVPALVRRVIHRDAAEALAGVGATPAQVADHVIRGADGHGPRHRRVALHLRADADRMSGHRDLDRPTQPCPQNAQSTGHRRRRPRRAQPGRHGKDPRTSRQSSGVRGHRQHVGTLGRAGVTGVLLDESTLPTESLARGPARRVPGPGADVGSRLAPSRNGRGSWPRRVGIALLRLEDCDGVLVGVLEPGGTADAW